MVSGSWLLKQPVVGRYVSLRICFFADRNFRHFFLLRKILPGRLLGVGKYNLSPVPYKLYHIPQKGESRITMEPTTGKAKYYTLMEVLKEQILSGTIKPGEKLPSENELTRQYNLSRHTVRKALSLLENEGYVTAHHGKGTFCSERVIQRHNSKNIAVVTTYLSDYIFPRLIQGMDRVLGENGYSIILKNTCNSRSKEEKVLKELLDKPIDGLIIEPSKSQILCRHINLYEMLDKYQIPYVFIQGCYPQMAGKPCILMDDCKGGYLLTRHLLETGRRNIIGIFKADDSQGAQRHKGYVEALQEEKIAYDPENVIWFHTEDRKTKPSLMLSMLLDNRKNVDAVVCYNDQIALAVIAMLEERGVSVPEDIAVTGYDNSLIGQNSPIGITTINHPQEKLGEMAAELILEKIRKIPEEESSVKRLICPELIVRASTASRK